MKTTGFRSFILYLLTGGFVACMVFFLYEFFTQGGQWVAQPYNQHLVQNGQLTWSGEILDANGVVLVGSEDGAQSYIDDAGIRSATVHTVGDKNGYISTGVQLVYRPQLAGYNPVLGVAGMSGGTTKGSIELTIDSGLCETATELLGSRKGAVIIYNYQTGEVVCKASTPTFDPENIPEDIETNDAYKGAYLDRTLSSSFTPGSTFKVITAACAVENLSDWDSRTYSCDGSVVINGEEITCMGHHGEQTLGEALGNSCNVYFAELAVDLGKDAMTRTAGEMGFNQPQSLDEIVVAASTYDVSEADDNALAWSGIGQYTTLVTPYHMMKIMGAIANDGAPVEPYLVRSITGVGPTSYTAKTRTGDEMITEEAAQALQTMLRANVEEYYASGTFPSELQVCAKTGTAEVGEGKEDTGWVAGYCANPDTPYAFAVVVEEGGFGRTSAAPIASQLLQQLAWG